MVLFSILAVMLIVLTIITVLVVGVAGAGFIVIFGDVIVCGVLIVFLMKHLIKRRRK